MTARVSSSSGTVRTRRMPDDGTRRRSRCRHPPARPCGLSAIAAEDCEAPSLSATTGRPRWRAESAAAAKRATSSSPSMHRPTPVTASSQTKASRAPRRRRRPGSQRHHPGNIQSTALHREVHRDVAALAEDGHTPFAAGQAVLIGPERGATHRGQRPVAVGAHDRHARGGLDQVSLQGGSGLARTPRSPRHGIPRHRFRPRPAPAPLRLPRPCGLPRRPRRQCQATHPQNRMWGHRRGDAGG